jgi:glycerol-3-phosphate dehydrogenase
MLSIFGGKITTYRRLAEEALERLEPVFPHTKAKAGWTAREKLPGGGFAPGEGERMADALRADYPFLSAADARRMTRAYGTDARLFLGQAQSWADLGFDLGAGFSEAEARYLIAAEWAETGEDVLWRRSKLGLHMTPAQRAIVDECMEQW